MTKANFGVIGVAAMGRNLALNIESRGYTALFAIRAKKTEVMQLPHPDKNFVPSYDIESCKLNRKTTEAAHETN